MLHLLKNMQKLSDKLYKRYDAGLLTQNEYLELLKPLDAEIEKIELALFNTHLQDISVYEKLFLKPTHL